MQARGIGVRLVKGAYSEPPAVAFPEKAAVDAEYLELARQMTSAEGRARGSRAVFGTHDLTLIGRIREHARAGGVAADAFEFHMLYGIQRTGQRRLASDGARVRVLIAYGGYWFPWYMRRLAERPANVWFVVKSVVS
jgi:proline dehydrogenase